MDKHLTRLMCGVAAQRVSDAVRSVSRSLAFDRKIAYLSSEAAKAKRQYVYERKLNDLKTSIENSLKKPGLMDLEIARNVLDRRHRYPEINAYLPKIAAKMGDVKKMRSSRRRLYDAICEAIDEEAK